MSAVERYFTRLLGMELTDGGGCVRSEARLMAHAPFLLQWEAAELEREGAFWRSLAPHLPKEAQSVAFVAEALQVLTCESPAPQQGEAQPIDANMHVLGGARLPCGPAFGIDRAGAVVSWAGAACVGDVWNVTVETAPAWRGKGYAAACLGQLTQHLLDGGDVPLYLCDVGNRASLATALAAGYQPYGTLWRAVHWEAIAQGED